MISKTFFFFFKCQSPKQWEGPLALIGSALFVDFSDDSLGEKAADLICKRIEELKAEGVL